MTVLMVLALTVPPSLAAVLWRVLCMVEAQAKKLATEDRAQIFILRTEIQAIGQLEARCDDHQAELKRLAEQVTNLTERVYRQ